MNLELGAVMSRPHFVVGNVGLKRIGGVAGLPKADLYIDARAFPDDAGMRSAKIQADQKVNSINGAAKLAVRGLQDIVDEAIKHIARRRTDELDPYQRPFVIVAFCAFGINRSVAIREIVASYLKGLGLKVENVGVMKP